MHPYDPLFYIPSEKMPFSIRLEHWMKSSMDEGCLRAAVDETMKRFPYFCIEVKEQDGALVTVPNPRPVVVYEGEHAPVFGSEEMNRHWIAVSYYGKRICLHATHVMADGGGLAPLQKTLIYHYLTRREGREFNTDGVRFPDTPFFADECAPPYDREALRGAKPLAKPNSAPIFRLPDGGVITDDRPTVYRFRVAEKDVMRYSHGHDASPCALVASLMAKAVWAVHPEVTDDLVCDVSYNMRGALGCPHNYRLLSSALSLRYPKRLQEASVERVCTCTRGMISLQSQPENARAYLDQKCQFIEAVNALPTVEEKRRFVGPRAIADANRNTFSVSYVGKSGFGDMERYLVAIYNLTDGSTQGGVMIEISAWDGWFNFAFLQGFSTDVYVRAFLRELDKEGLVYKVGEHGPLTVGGYELPN